MQHVRRIAVVGPPGSGKSTVAVRLGEVLGLPVIHLDRLYWSADWTEAPPEVFRERHTQAIEADRWVIEGLYSAASDIGSRLRRTDLIVVTEAPTIVCLWRVIVRWLRHRCRPRAGAPPGRELVSLEFLRFIVTWRRRHPDFLAEVARHAPTVRIVRVRSRRDLEALAESLRRGRR